MENKNMRHTKRIKNLIIVSALTAIVLAVSTYAWFVGTQAVNVNSFDVEIETTDSLLLSLDGRRWSPEVTISKEDLETVSYEDHTNNWGDLIPVSSIGDMDTDASRMKLYEKSSFTPVPGGYRLMVSRVKNYTKTEGKLEAEKNGYVVFDLFIRNISGEQYLTEYNILDEEAIYLTTDSEVKVAAAGIKNTGIENSVRVAFAQIGRVKGTITDQSTITGITCVNTNGVPEYDETSGVTGICRKAQIWEPNDTKHVNGAISWYNKSCLERLSSGTDVTLESSYGDNNSDQTDTCRTVADGTAYKTYSTKDELLASDNVNIYDGADYNGYETAKLTSYSYFTDTMKGYTGTTRPTFMTLAPNSVTKVRVYIFIEGQDIDNYDFSSIGKSISVKFGFTKERFIDTDIDYEGPDRDTTRPVITLKPYGETEEINATMTVGGTYTEPGATATDNVDGNLTSDIVIDDSDLDTTKAGTYIVTYSVKDASGNSSALMTRYVIVETAE